MGFKSARGDTRISWRVAEPVWQLYIELRLSKRCITHGVERTEVVPNV